MGLRQAVRRSTLADANERRDWPKGTGVVCDQSVSLNGFKATKDYPEHLRRVRFKDPTDKTLIFLTNNTTLPAPVIA
jgi:hypothetical protein